MKLHRVISPLKIIDRPISKTHWMLDKDIHIELVTNEGTIRIDLFSGWVTDHRSGSSIADCVIPKWATDDDIKRGIKPSIYNAVVAAHDMMYSGWASKALADDLFYQGLILAGVSKINAQTAYSAVRLAWWSWTDLDSKMPRPYTTNRYFESFNWDAK